VSIQVDEGCTNHCYGYDDVLKVVLESSLGHEEGVVLCWRRDEGLLAMAAIDSNNNEYLYLLQIMISMTMNDRRCNRSIEIER